MMANQPEGLKEAIRQRYAGAALSVKQAVGNPVADAKQNACHANSSCCADSSCCTADFTGGAYSIDELTQLPDTARLASLGCGNPTALAELHAGETVLDLGSGGGIDVLLSAKRVGPTGKAYGLDMTDEMLDLARENQQKSGLTNVEFLKGDIEAIPLPDNHVDVIISNCVINLAGDKDQVLREAFRVLKPGGRLAVSDIVFQGDVSLIPPEVLRRVQTWAGCIAGALTETAYQHKLAAAGFTDIGLQVTHVYDQKNLEEWVGPLNWPNDQVRAVSAFIRAVKPL